MPYFEITAATSRTDTSALWIRAASLDQLNEYLVGCPHLRVTNLPAAVDADDLDFILPQGAIDLRERLLELAEAAAAPDHPTELVTLLLGLLRCPALIEDEEALDEVTTQAMFDANLYITKHFPERR